MEVTLNAEQFKPTANRVLVDPDPVEPFEANKAGILLPKRNPRRVFWGTVIAAGSDVEGRIKKGDRVLYYEQDAQEVEYEEGKSFLVFHEPHLILSV